MDQTEDSAQTPVVSFFEKVLDGWKVSKAQIRSWLSRYGKQYVEDKVHLTEKSNPRAPGAFLNAALKFDWQPADKATVAIKSTQENRQMHTTLPFMPTDEENRHWYQSLTEKQKLGLYEDACLRWPMLGYHFKSANVTPLDENLNNSYVFNLFMEQIGRRKAKTLQDVIREERESEA